MNTIQHSIAALGAVAAISTVPAMAQNLSFGADNFYKSNTVELQPISFLNQYQTTVAGNLFVPRNLSSSGNASAIVAGHPMGAVKEQSSNLYATKLAE